MTASADASATPDIICIGETTALVTPTDGPLADAHQATISLAGAESNVAAGFLAATLDDRPMAERRLQAGHDAAARVLRIAADMLPID
ncbi:hypothetical protein KEC56_10965 [Microbacterium sp. YMB-B2]|uniref:Sugar kinase n=1 Tax=Microbacterium tenebrionis TaxID=2830665 RepID=A0A9X1RZX3_9MICO|nr:hypothetical protein [Microbacterium tenebrionis]MCC2030026.1 hypothetical protein [Microbacterium tenebrionis]